MYIYRERKTIDILQFTALGIWGLNAGTGSYQAPTVELTASIIRCLLVS